MVDYFDYTQVKRPKESPVLKIMTQFHLFKGKSIIICHREERNDVVNFLLLVAKKKNSSLRSQ